jgi:RNA polymerase sigma-70 factor (ECF subfamily)
MEPAPQTTSSADASPERSGEAQRWVAAAADGDMQAFRRLYDHFLPYLRHAAARLGGPNAKLDGVIQDVFVEVYQRLGDFHPDDSFRTWLYRVARDVTASHLHDQKKITQLAELALLRLDARALATLESCDQVRALYAALDQVSVQSREAFILFEVEGRELGEIVELTDTAIYTVTARIRRANERIRTFICRDTCPSDRDSCERLGGLLEAASAWQPSGDASAAADLFADIASRIKAADMAHAELAAPDAACDGSGARRWVYGVVGLAAGVLLTLAGFYLFPLVTSDRVSVDGVLATQDAGAREVVEPRATSQAEAQRLPPDLERLRARADRATTRGDHHDAVRYYRSLLDRLPPMHPIAAAVHLDLADIYLHRLNSPGRAAPHLRTFVERWPSDVETDSARHELCKIDASQPGCEVGE